ncbi:hypothetical protein [Streptomyces sp. MUSC 14]|uniref:hypothetical protein n=1 Tax=Streptomyces sp. MUSC 14 TaxID=1354889 RepID=UPI0015A660D4|nr:hypothetical protein [Streptomyces sp. MUSC 14]
MILKPCAPGVISSTGVGVDAVWGEEVTDPVDADEQGVEMVGHPRTGGVEKVGFL